MRLGLVLAMIGGACGDDGAMQPPPDAGAIDAPCTLAPGNAWIYQAAHVLPSDSGFDLDGDGDIDNELGQVPTTALDQANAGLDASIASGELLLVMYVTGWSDPPTPDDPDVSLNFFQVYDADMPLDTSNNFGGEGRFLVPVTQFDLSCRSKTEADETSLAGGVLTASKDAWRFTLSTGLGTLAFARARLVTTFSPDFGAATTRLGAVMSLCSLSAMAYPGDVPGSVLDVLVNDASIGSSVQVDVDVDGDGIEQVRGDGVSILECVDGDGTVISGRDCPCHPDIVDGYTLGMEFPAVAAEVVGTF